MISELLVIFFCAFIAFSLSAVCGGGAGLLMMPALGLTLPASQIPASLSIGTFTSSASRIAFFTRHIRWKIFWWFVPTAIPAAFIGAWLLHYINPVYLEIVMGIFLVGNLPALFRKSNDVDEPGAKHVTLLGVGFLAGFLSGLTGAVGLLFNRFYLRYGLSKEQIVATRAANEVRLHIIKLCLYVSFGLITGRVIGIGAAVALGGLTSTWFMKWGLKKISKALFSKVGYASMVISGVVMLTQSTDLLFSGNNAYLSFAPISGGIESKLQWQRASFAIEFEYDEGLEYEQKIPFSELPVGKQVLVSNQKGDADAIIVEEVFGVGTHSYEAYFFKDHNLVKKIDI